MSTKSTPPQERIATQIATSDQPWQNAAVLTHLYQHNGLTTREIADRLGCNHSTVSRWLNIHGIETRENWKAGVEAARRANRSEYARVRTLPSGYEYWSSKEGSDRTNRLVYVHRLLAVAEHGFDAVADTQVHHRNGIPFDNRPDNIELLDAAEHGQLHSNNYWNSGGR
ncbi:helix-turn-helix domain-containing protein [Halorussus marinus]|uniref:helix-turn-helix domain-containing protein n=1 Tax=Halorussus marinus TaxID=2505976 RepID=UPI00106E5C0D|nr:helix-turn-helix domain-containing protein [Halorussus marinus]